MEAGDRPARLVQTPDRLDFLGRLGVELHNEESPSRRLGRRHCVGFRRLSGWDIDDHLGDLGSGDPNNKLGHLLLIQTSEGVAQTLVAVEVLFRVLIAHNEVADVVSSP